MAPHERDLSSIVKETLEAQGFLRKFKAQIRAQVFNALKEKTKDHPSEAPFRGASSETMTALHLVYDFLDHYSLECARSVLETEADVTRDGIKADVSSLGISSTSGGSLLEGLVLAKLQSSEVLSPTVTRKKPEPRQEAKVPAHVSLSPEKSFERGEKSVDDEEDNLTTTIRHVRQTAEEKEKEWESANSAGKKSAEASPTISPSSSGDVSSLLAKPLQKKGLAPIGKGLPPVSSLSSLPTGGGHLSSLSPHSSVDGDGSLSETSPLGSPDGGKKASNKVHKKKNKKKESAGASSSSSVLGDLPPLGGAKGGSLSSLSGLPSLSSPPKKPTSPVASPGEGEYSNSFEEEDVEDILDDIERSSSSVDSHSSKTETKTPKKNQIEESKSRGSAISAAAALDAKHSRDYDDDEIEEEVEEEVESLSAEESDEEYSSQAMGESVSGFSDFGEVSKDGDMTEFDFVEEVKPAADFGK